MTLPGPRTLALALAFVAAYVLLDWLSYVQPVLKLGITPWNPQAGLALALLLARGAGWGWIVALAALASELVVRDNPAGLPVLAASSAVIALGYTAAAVFLRPRLAGPISNPVQATWLVGTAMAATLLVAAGYAIVYLAANLLPAQAVVPGIARYWVGDLNGVITVVPLFALLPMWRAGLGAIRRRALEVAAQALATMGILWLVVAFPADEVRFFYPLFVPVIWIALRWGVPGAALATLGMQAGLVVTVEDRLDFLPFVDIQFLMLTLGTTALLLGAVVSERRRALERVAAQEAEQRALLATAPDAVLSLDAGGRVVSANPAALRMFAAGGGALEALPAGQLLPGLELVAREGRSSLSASRLDGTRFPVDIAWAGLDSPAAARHIVIVRDATERHAAQARLRERDTALARSMRFAVAGELASALTHELNQPITALVSYLQAAQILAEPIQDADERLPGTLEKAAREAMRASDVMRRLRDFYSGGAPRTGPVDLAEAIEGVRAAFAERVRRDGISLELDLPAGLPPACCDRIQLEMVLHNLLGNACEAAAAQPPDLRRVRLSAQPSGDGLRIEVDDSGPGIAEEVAPRLFEPFLTTKPDGMGLGLAISRSLLQAQSADLALAPSRLGGACFAVQLPIRCG
ncbi:MAG: ATP-binding protein [Steroidobacteraceae bacterium]|jgi:signal transduction histidine kinase|nr:ATP-binding protein [Steroidobacteraceae bacterium]